MRPNTLHSREPDPSSRRVLRSSLSGIALGIVFLFTLALASGAADLPAFSGEFNPVSVAPGPAGQTAVPSSQRPRRRRPGLR